MNRNIVIVIVVVILLAAAAGAYHFIHKSQEQQSAAQSAVTQAQPQKTTQNSVSKSLADFFSMTGSQECTYSSSANSNAGTVYIGDGKMRGDFQASANGTTQDSHMINDGTYVYIWTDGKATGEKMSDSVMKSFESQAIPTGAAQSSSQPVNMTQKANYSCSPWSVDQSKFAVPQNVTFTDYSAMMQGFTTTPQAGNTAQGSQAACSECNQVPAGAARSECLSALKCPVTP